jgi:hypothetical protein
VNLFVKEEGEGEGSHLGFKYHSKVLFHLKGKAFCFSFSFIFFVFFLSFKLRQEKNRTWAQLEAQTIISS